ncbi:Ig-like domain-containing protein [Protaetiibacter intestinalis]|uniref:Fibronectin type III domain-containing protein n=1 Tax=Protaetiibacter intestinalis TaxID=2419774 RepID=A0A387B840_9MICO|nr:Ig-like domain-containing protein [Protaetiibacter intestinalis]AYF98513.1 fibronectin type III domain-containing protein [Protaetiibacter intestinalis]
MGGIQRARRKTIASAAVVALVAGGTLTVAALHPGFPVTDVDLTSRDVWVTNAEQQLGGRLNRQIDELNGSVTAASPNFEVLQDGDALFLVDPDNLHLESVDPATTSVTSSVDLPADAEVSYGGDVLAVVSGGKLWALPAVGDLQLNTVSQPPLLDLGKGGHAVVTASGAIVAVSPQDKTLYRIPTLADVPVESAFPKIGDFQLAAIGETVVALDTSTNELVTEDGTVRPLGDERALKLQQSGPASEFAILATGAGLLRVALGSGEVETLDAGGASSNDPDDVAAPVNLDGCAHGAWAHAQLYMLACQGQQPATQDIEQPTAGDRLEFRVNRSIVVLNNLSNGNVWVPSENMRLVDNWDDITPPEQEETEEEGDEKSALQSFEDTLAERTDENRDPTAVDDAFGARPGRTTILSVLDNDSDPDGDVLIVSEFGSVAESSGTLDLIDGDRALQFTPSPTASGTLHFSYTVDDGRGGHATAQVSVHVVPEGSNEAPVELRRSAVTVEANQTVEYNVLANWRDPDGDDMIVVGAAPTSGDLVQFTPDGVITFTHQTSELGEKEVQFQVSDGTDGGITTGTLTVTVQPAGSQKPVGTPDFATAFTGEEITLKPLGNDISPSGALLAITGIEDPGEGASATLDTDKNAVRFSASKADVYYFEYTLVGNGIPSVGIIRVDVKDVPAEQALPPIAVKDTAYLRGDQPTTVSVLTNDVSPAGRILAVQSIQVPPELTAKGVVVELLEATQVRITSPQALTSQVSFTYTISDGLNTATAGVTVVPVAPLTKHQPPVALDDFVTVRAGDIVTVDVLANDRHPDDSRMFLDEALIAEPSAGIAFVSDDKVRFQAPTEPGQYRADYRVLDAYGESAAASVVFTVTPFSEDGNRDPKPEPVVARVLAGGTITIPLPLQQIDPDGDSTQLLRFPTGPTLGSITDQGEDFFEYTASPAASGTDTFSYQVYDTFGATGTAEIRIAVIPQPDEPGNPSAVPDSVSVRPGKIAQVDLTLNDSDPQGSPISVSEDLIDVPKGIEAEVVGHRYLVLTAPKEEGSFSLRYTLTNGTGGSAVTYVLVQVTPTAPLLPPSADDLALTLKDIAGKKSVTVDIFDGSAFNPAGSNDALEVSLEGPNASSAELVPDQHGKISVTPGERRQAIAYRVTDPETKLSATAFLLVPAAVDDSYDDPPRIDPNLPTQYVSMNEAREWKLSDILEVPSGREAWIPDASTVSSIQSDGTSNYVDKGTIRFQGGLDYRGPASISFTVTDGASKDDPKGNTIPLTMTIIVGDPEFRDTPPTWTPPNIQLEVGETSTFDLRTATGHPNEQIRQEVTYSDLQGIGGRITGSLDGSTLTVSTPRNTPKGTTFELDVTLRWDKFVVPGRITVTVVGSTRAPAVAVADDYETQRGDGAVVASPLVNDSNPYGDSGEPLTIVGAEVQNSGEPAVVTFTDDTVRITPNASLKSGTVVVFYTIQDATEDPDRQTTGTITVVVSDVPDQPQKPTVPTQGDEGTVQIGFQAPATNGKPITSYEVRSTPSATMPTNCGPPSCTITGLTNGTSYQFSVRAINEHGPGAWSEWSNAVIPYGTPGTPTVAIAVSDQWAPNAVISASWSGVSANGGSVSYRWRLDNGSWNSTTGTSTGNQTVQGGNHTFEVFAVNSGGKEGAHDSEVRSIQTQTVPNAPGGLTATVTDSQAPGAIRWNWNATSASTGGTANLSYQVSTDGSNWVSPNNGTLSHARSGLAQGEYSLWVRAVNKAGSSGATGPVKGTVTSPPPPTATIVSKTAQAVDGCSSGCYAANVRLDNISAGTYTIVMAWESGWDDNSKSGYVSSGGTLRTSGATGTLPTNERLIIRVTGPSGSFDTGYLTRAQWAAIPTT